MILKELLKSYTMELFNEKNSNKTINNPTIEIARPSIPSIKLIEFIMATIIKIVNN